MHKKKQKWKVEAAVKWMLIKKIPRMILREDTRRDAFPVQFISIRASCYNFFVLCVGFVGGFILDWAACTSSSSAAPPMTIALRL